MESFISLVFFFFYLAWQQSGYYKVNATVRERIAVITPGVSSQ